MPLSVECGNEVGGDWSLAAAAFGRELSEEVGATESFAVLLVEALGAEFLAAVSADEVVGVPGLVEGSDALVLDGSVAVGAARREEVVVVVLAVRAGGALEEVAVAQFLAAMSAEEVLGVPHLPQRDHHLSHDGLPTGGAVALGDGADAMPAHVRLQARHHRVQLTLTRLRRPRSRRRPRAAAIRLRRLRVRRLFHRLPLHTPTLPD